jgi:hypothetical protein
MSYIPSLSELRVEKSRADAILTLSNGETLGGCFFVSKASPRVSGPERVGELLNGERGFFPFEVHDQTGARTALLNRGHVLVVTLAEDEARRDAGYEMASERRVSLLLTNGQSLEGVVRIYQPETRARVSDWTRDGGPFRYLENGGTTLLVNQAHIIEVREVRAEESV